MLAIKHMTKAEKKVYHSYMAKSNTHDLYHLAKLLIDILSCKHSCEHTAIHEYFRETVNYLSDHAKHPERMEHDYLLGTSPAYAKKCLISLYTYSMSTLDLSVPILCSNTLYLLNIIEEFVSEKRFQTLKNNLCIFSKLSSNTWCNEAEDNESTKTVDSYGDDDDEYDPYSPFPMDDLKGFLPDDSDSLEWDWDDEDDINDFNDDSDNDSDDDFDDDLNDFDDDDCEDDFDDEFCNF